MVEVPTLPDIEVCPEESDEDDPMVSQVETDDDPEGEVMNEILLPFNSLASCLSDDEEQHPELTKTSAVATENSKKKSRRCGACEPCQLYLQYEMNERTKTQSGVPKHLRFKCGTCKACKGKWKKCCINVKCKNPQ